MIPALLSCVADIGDARYQNITYAVIITAGVGIGAGLAPALLGLSGGGQAIQKAREAFSSFLKVLVAIASLQTQFMTLDQALKVYV